MIITRMTVYKDRSCDLCGDTDKLLVEIASYKDNEDESFLHFIICEICLAHIQKFLEKFMEEECQLQ